MVNKSWFTSFNDSKVMPGADCDSDHNPVVAKLNHKAYKTASKTTPVVRYNLDSLQKKILKAHILLKLKTGLETLWTLYMNRPLMSFTRK